MHVKYMYRLKNESDIEDCIHNIFMKIYERPLKSYILKPVAWIRKVTDNYIKDLFKKNKQTVELNESLNYTDMYIETVDNSCAVEALKKMDPVSADIVVLKFYHGYTYREIMKMLDLGFSTIRTKWKHAKNFLKDFRDE